MGFHGHRLAKQMNGNESDFNQNETTILCKTLEYPRSGVGDH